MGATIVGGIVAVGMLISSAGDTVKESRELLNTLTRE